MSEESCDTKEAVIQKMKSENCLEYDGDNMDKQIDEVVMKKKLTEGELR